MYSPYIGSLCKLFFFSSAVQQTVFCLFSSLPFAVGQSMLCMVHMKYVGAKFKFSCTQMFFIAHVDTTCVKSVQVLECSGSRVFRF
jgi:hypothetical protein